MNSSSASSQGNPAGITISLQMGISLKVMEVNKNCGKILSYGRGILGTFL